LATASLLRATVPPLPPITQPVALALARFPSTTLPVPLEATEHPLLVRIASFLQ
jgi:hypothetical protein